MKIQNVIVHELIKEQKKTVANTQPAKSVLVVNDSVTKLVDAIFKMYAGKANKGYGRFRGDEGNFPFANHIRAALIERTVPFFETSLELLELLRLKVEKAVMATGGYVLMAHVEEDAVGYFIVCIINNVGGSVIDKNTLQVKDVEHIDFSNLRIAGRLNIDQWQSDDKAVRYLGFLKQRGEVTEYFQEFLGSQNLLMALQETKKLVSCVKEFADEKKIIGDHRTSLLEAVHSYLNECGEKKQPLSLDVLANKVWPEEPDMLRAKFAQKGVEVEDGFVPDRRGITTLVHIKHKSKFWTIDLNPNAIGEGYAEYREDLGGLLLTKLDQEFVQELKNLQNDDD